jgi:pimeloyl-ACP methyl ester carboxylesterase
MKITIKTAIVYLAAAFSIAAWSAQIMAQPYERPAADDPSIFMGQYTHGPYNMAYAYSGNVAKPGILFVHGTPGEWQAFGMYLNNRSLQEDYFMVSLDRIGWGQSTIDEEAMLEQAADSVIFSEQAKSIAALMDRYPDKKWILVGHSLGASIVPKVAISEEHRVVGMVLLAGSLQPRLGRPRWYNRLAATILVKWMIPKMFRYSNDEIMVLRAELKLMEDEILAEEYSTQTVVIQGMTDKLVSPRNIKYVRETWPAAFPNLKTIDLPNSGHFIPWEHTDLVIQNIREISY